MQTIPMHWLWLFPMPPSPVGGHLYSFTCPKGFLLPSSIYWCSCHLSPRSSCHLSPEISVRNRWDTHIRVIWEEFNKGLFAKLEEGFRESTKSNTTGLWNIVAIVSLKVWGEGKEDQEPGGLCGMKLIAGRLTLDKTRPWQSHSNGNKCYTPDCFSLFKLL